MSKVYKFDEVLNDLMDYFILGDPDYLLNYQRDHNLPEDLLTEFTTKATGDQVVEDGIMVPLAGVENYPYIIYFNLSNHTPELLKEGNKLQVRQDGYCLKVENNQIYLFTMPYLRQFTADKVETLKRNRTATISLENGWYSVEVLGGETIQEMELTDKDGQIAKYQYLEPTFEFIITPSPIKPKYTADISYFFKIETSE
ncbi:hypothetical protein [Pedobacter xixiisoli]|uniref:Uncharacterized protein n=1 Tax=Pedobacter xixiisoli TaxID=1476464 RepID=A0A285ZPL6_9SPHI|nr:hypothetical protein [Pedobacter xixiisoli]SOD11594.1 hypothetical protein SAMN06297358_0228 [Pedobacter xixiisoli]